MKNTTIRLSMRSIRTSKRRWVALFLIVMLSVGFFAGLKVCRDQMWMACQNYLKDQNFYDYRMYSSFGFTEDEIDDIQDKLTRDGVSLQSIEGMKSMDAAGEYEDEKGTAQSGVFLLMSMPEEVNLPSLVSGRMPASDDECVIDSKAAESGIIGHTITFPDAAGLENKTYTIVGTADSPLFLNADRGSSDIGNGEINGFVYLTPDNFTFPRFTEADMTLTDTEDLDVYSDNYNEAVDSVDNEVKDALSSAADEAVTYALKRSENNGYVSYKNDTSIIDGIANVFPVFFILIALLVFITTMTRMVEEERTQIGTLKALGCSDFSITMKYMLYAGSAALIGWVIGFFAGTWGLPRIFWWAYRNLYNFAPLPYVFSIPMALLTLGVALAAVILSTWTSCRGELLSTPAVLIRPKSAKPGKRIWLERIRPLWKRLPFLRKVTLRNMFRYKMRMIMMLIGVGSCTALVLTGFGVRDSMIHVGDMQFDDIQTYQLTVNFDNGEDAQSNSISELENNEHVDKVIPCVSRLVDASTDNRMGSVNLMSFKDGEDISAFWHLKPSDGSEGLISLPKQKNKAVISKRLAEKLGLHNGDTFKIEESISGKDDPATAELTVDGIFTNYIDNYIFINEKTCQDIFDEDFSEMVDACLVKTKDTPDDALLEDINDMNTVTGVNNLEDTRNDVGNSVSCLNYIIWLLVFFSGALSFIVIFNLTNINLAERSREIATVEVLGFYPKETRSYVLWENLVISILAGFIGLPGGWLFTRFVLSRVLLDNLTFPFIVHKISYLLTLICTILFAAIVNMFMRRSIAQIHMAESLKAVE